MISFCIISDVNKIYDYVCIVDIFQLILNKRQSYQDIMLILACAVLNQSSKMLFSK